MKINKGKLYSVTDLLKCMKERGLPSSRVWLYTVEKQEKLVCPRLPNSRADRVFTQSQIEEVIQAFSVGGKGYWRYK